MIYHFITETDLSKYLTESELRVPSLDTEGFIHCSTLEQVLDVANFLAPYSEEMQLLEIDESLVSQDVRFEDAMGDGRLFPHVYGPINRDAIVAEYHLDWDGEEGYTMPVALKS